MTAPSAIARRHRPSTAAFTLVEVLVALAIVSIALSAAFRTVSGSTDAAALIRDRTLALWVAENRLAAAQLAARAPDLGERTGDAVQAGRSFWWREQVSATPNPFFRRIEIRVGESGRPDYAIARVVGFIPQASLP